jgi:hypothetical protein
MHSHLASSVINPQIRISTNARCRGLGDGGILEQVIVRLQHPVARTKLFVGLEG